jgi:hypothetical protein
MVRSVLEYSKSGPAAALAVSCRMLAGAAGMALAHLAASILVIVGLYLDGKRPRRQWQGKQKGLHPKVPFLG